MSKQELKIIVLFFIFGQSFSSKTFFFALSYPVANSSDFDSFSNKGKLANKKKKINEDNNIATATVTTSTTTPVFTITLTTTTANTITTTAATATTLNTTTTNNNDNNALITSIAYGDHATTTYNGVDHFTFSLFRFI